MTYDTVGEQDVRGENINKAVTGFALREYVFKQLCTVVNSSKWQESYYQETAADLTGGAGNAVKGVPRLATFPHVEPSWQKQSSYHVKHGSETTISWEDINSDEIDVVARSLLRVARAVTKSVDTEIWNTLYENGNPTNILEVNITNGHEWDAATIANRDPIQNILDAKKEIAEEDYNPDSNGYLLLNPKDFANLLGNANVRNAGQFYTDDVTRNGKVGFLLGLKVLVSNNVTAGHSMVCIGKEACTWQQLAPLRTVKIEEPGINIIIRSWEVGVGQLKNPKAVCLISGTAA